MERYSFGGTTTPASPWIGSRTNAAKDLAASLRCSDSTSPYGTNSVLGSNDPNPSLQKAFDIKDSAPQVRPWKPPAAHRIPGRPVYARANLIAASMPSLPELAKNALVRRPPASVQSLSASLPARSATWLCSIAGPDLSSSSLRAATTRG